MKRFARKTTILWVLVVGSGVWLGAGAAQAATVTDTLEAALTGKQWCQGNPAFSEPFKVIIDPKYPAKNTLLTLTQDPSGTGQRTTLQGVLNTQGGNPSLDAILLKGRAYPSNTTGRQAQLVLSGTQPGHPEHSLTIRGQASFDSAGHLTAASGTYNFQATSTYTTNKKTGAPSSAVECFNSGTVATKGKALIVGTFIDRPVDGLRYTTTSNPVGGITSGGGHYLCRLGAGQ